LQCGLDKIADAVVGGDAGGGISGGQVRLKTSHCHSSIRSMFIDVRSINYHY
jgi:hypothetical protein